MLGVKFVVNDGFLSRSWAFTFRQKIHFMKTTTVLACGQNMLRNYVNSFKEDYHV